MVEIADLHTDRLLLRRFRSGDVDDALAYRNDAEFVRYLPHIPHPFTRRDAEAFVAQNLDEPWDLLPTFAIVLDGKVIGTVNFEVDPHHQIAMLGFATGRQHWGKGIGYEAARAAVAWAFEAFDLVKIWATTDARNIRSQRLLEKLGMQREGLQRSHERSRDGRADKISYGLLREELSPPGASEWTTCRPCRNRYWGRSSPNRGARRRRGVVWHCAAVELGLPPRSHSLLPSVVHKRDCGCRAGDRDRELERWRDCVDQVRVSGERGRVSRADGGVGHARELLGRG